MTQALLNNLNILKDSSFNMKDVSLKTALTDFEKILDKKTNYEQSKRSNDKSNQNIIQDVKKEIKQNVNTNNTNNPIEQKTITSKSQLQETKQKITTDNTKTLGDLKNETKQEVLSEEIKTAVLENDAESVIDMIIEEDDNSQITEEKTKINEKDTSEDNTDEAETQETNITEEDSTMYKEIIAPENQEAVLLLSQIQTNVKLPVTDETEQAVHEFISFKTDENDLELNIPKQFEDILTSKDIPAVNTGIKDAVASKTEQPKQNAILSEKIVKELNIESVNSESAENSSSGDLMQNQTPQEQTVKIMIQGDLKTDARIEIAKTVEIKPVTISPEKIIEQISKQLEGMYNNSKLNMVLNPGTLGKLHLHLMNTKDGLIAQFTVTTQEAKDILMKGLNGLKDALLAQGINVDNVSVKLEDSESEEGFDWTEQEGSRGGNKQQGTRKQKEEEKPFEQMMFEMENNDNLV